MNEEYNKESKEAYIESSIKGFAYELYLLNKHQHKQTISIDRQLHEYLDCSWGLSEKEEKSIVRKAVKIANKEYGLNIK